MALHLPYVLIQAHGAIWPICHRQQFILNWADVAIGEMLLCDGHADSHSTA